MKRSEKYVPGETDDMLYKLGWLFLALGCAGWLFFRKVLVPLLPDMPCVFLQVLGIYCPGCGGTRAFQALLSLDILEALRLNPITLNLAVGFIAYEIYMLIFLFKKSDRKLFFNKYLLWITLIVWGIYFVARNVLLFCGIDVIGDVENLTTPSVFDKIIGLVSQ